MRALTLALGIALALAGCAGSAPEPAKRPVSYNRRDLPPDQPGLLTGPDGTWTLYSHDPHPPPAAEPASADEKAEPEPPRHRTILMCDHSRNCEQPQ